MPEFNSSKEQVLSQVQLMGSDVKHFVFKHCLKQQQVSNRSSFVFRTNGSRLISRFEHGSFPSDTKLQVLHLLSQHSEETNFNSG